MLSYNEGKAMNYTEFLLSNLRKWLSLELFLPKMIFLLYHLFWQIEYH